MGFLFDTLLYYLQLAFLSGSVGKNNLPAMQETWVQSWVGKIPWRRAWQLTPVFLPGESHGQRSLTDYSPRGCKESDMSDRLSTQNILSILYVPSIIINPKLFKSKGDWKEIKY